jgi:hypothetical protein
VADERRAVEQREQPLSVERIEDARHARVLVARWSMGCWHLLMLSARMLRRHPARVAEAVGEAGRALRDERHIAPELSSRRREIDRRLKKSADESRDARIPPPTENERACPWSFEIGAPDLCDDQAEEQFRRTV